LYPDFVADLEKIGTGDYYMDKLFSSAIAYVRMWHRATGAVLCGPTPRGTCLTPGKAKLEISESTAGKEKITVGLKKLTTSTGQSDFGDPVGAKTAYAVCIYDQNDALRGELLVNRAGQACAGKACWKAVGTDGWKYKDKDASSYGVAKILGKSGPAGAGKIRVLARNKADKAQRAMPTGLAAALQNNTQATVEILTSDASCFGATLSTIKTADGLEFKAGLP
jgi:hypothetical protein